MVLQNNAYLALVVRCYLSDVEDPNEHTQGWHITAIETNTHGNQFEAKFNLTFPPSSAEHLIIFYPRDIWTIPGMRQCGKKTQFNENRS